MLYNSYLNYCQQCMFDPQVIKAAETQLSLAKSARAHYRTLCKESKATLREVFTQDKFNPPPPHSSLPPLSNPITVHYSFDMAQQVLVHMHGTCTCKGINRPNLHILQVHYPSDPQQPGPMYFLTPRKCAIFGVCCEGVPRQV